MSDPLRGRLLAVHVSPGGVPKHPVDAAHVGRLGLAGDRQAHDTVHGGPHRAVCLLGIEAIRRVAAEGHPIVPGSVGENLTIEGIELGALPPGSRLAIGTEVLLELASPAYPCNLIRASFSDGRSARISWKTNPADSRLYARVLDEGVVRPGDAITVLPPEPGRATTLERLAQLDAAERKATLAIARAVAAAGIDLRIVEDKELLLVAEAGRAGGPWNGALGFTSLPQLVGRALDHYRRHGADGWLELDPGDPEAPTVPPIESRVVLAAAPEELTDGSAAGVVVRAIGPEDGGAWGVIVDRALAEEGPSAELPWATIGPALAATPGTTLLLATLDGAPAGAAILQIHHGAAWLSGAAVAPEARGRGIHRALVGERIRIGRTAGCDLVGADAESGSRSEGILRRAGLEPLGRRSRWPAAAFARESAS